MKIINISERNKLGMILKYGLLNIGFNTVDEFEKFNKEMCYKEFR